MFPTHSDIIWGYCTGDCGMILACLWVILGDVSGSFRHKLGLLYKWLRHNSGIALSDFRSCFQVVHTWIGTDGVLLLPQILQLISEPALNDFCVRADKRKVVVWAQQSASYRNLLLIQCFKKPALNHLYVKDENKNHSTQDSRVVPHRGTN